MALALEPPIARFAPAAADPARGRSRWLALGVLCVGMLMIVLDQTVVNVALPAIQRELGFSQSSLAWVVNAYMIAFAGLLLLAGRLGDLVGRKRVLIAGLSLFTAASLLCGLSFSQELLIAARWIQGVGGALAQALILGMIVALFPEPRERARAIGFFSFVAAAGGSIGLLAGGVLTQLINWHWIFFVNVPIGILAVVLAARLLATERGLGLGEGADLPGAALVTAALMLGVYTIVGEAAEHGFGALRTLLVGALAIGLFVAFLGREATARRPLLPLRLFRSRTISGANAIQALMVAGLFGMFFLGSLYLQLVLRYDALQIGLAFLPVALAIGGLSIELAARLITRFGARTLLTVGLVFILAGLVWFARVPVLAEYVTDVLPSMLLLGIGGGVAFPALMTVAMSDVAPSDAGLASGVVGTSAQVGGALGLALLATLSSAVTARLVADGVPRAEALVDGFHLAYVLAAALVLVSLGLTLSVLPAASSAPVDSPEALGFG